jgi:glutaminyl-tRNA synthetase
VPKYKRLYPDGPECRLKGAYLVTCTGCVKDDRPASPRYSATYDPASRGGDPADGRKVKGATIHWVDAENCADAEVRLYDNLFSDPDPDGPDKNFLDCLNPEVWRRSPAARSRRSRRRRPMPVKGKTAEGYQFMREGYFCLDCAIPPIRDTWFSTGPWL